MNSSYMENLLRVQPKTGELPTSSTIPSDFFSQVNDFAYEAGAPWLNPRHVPIFLSLMKGVLDQALTNNQASTTQSKALSHLFHFGFLMMDLRDLWPAATLTLLNMAQEHVHAKSPKAALGFSLFGCGVLLYHCYQHPEEILKTLAAVGANVASYELGRRLHYLYDTKATNERNKRPIKEKEEGIVNPEKSSPTSPYFTRSKKNKKEF